MNNPPAPPIPDAHGAPLDDFSHCHAGITTQLTALRGLPVLLAAAARAREVAAATLAFVPDVVFKHHAEEEHELFPAALASAHPGAERQQVQALTSRLTGEHRHIEAMWKMMEPALKAAAQGRDGALDVAAVEALVQQYLAHAAFEEREFLPLCQTILGRNGNHMAALGVSLHMRRVMPDVLQRFGHRI